jgi:4-hydroxybenzoate polyprenyltransferase
MLPSRPLFGPIHCSREGANLSGTIWIRSYWHVPLFRRCLSMAAKQQKVPRNFSLEGFLRLTRFGNLLIIILAQYFTAIFLIPTEHWQDWLWSGELLLLSLSTSMIAAAGYIINDYYDVKIDLINKPERVVVGVVLKRRIAMVAHTLLNVTGILMGAYLAWWMGALHFFSALLLWYYSNQLKRMPFLGNFSVGILTGLAIYVIAMYFDPGNIKVLLYAIFAFFFTLIREVIKDLEDLKGDSRFGCRTLPIVWGIRKTKRFILWLTLLFLMILAVGMGYFLEGEVSTYAWGLIFPILYFLLKVFLADTKKEYTTLSMLCKLIMLLGILTMVLN